MEEVSNAEMENDTSNEQSVRTRVGFPQQSRPRKFPLKALLVVFILIIGALVGWWFFIRTSGESIPPSEETTPTPFAEESTPTPTQIAIDRSGIKIQVFNGTGMTGAAGDLKKELEGIGYTQIDVGNASKQNFTATVVVFDGDLPENVRVEIQNLLNSLYQDVEVQEKSLDKYNLQITTGYPKGHTPTPTSKPKSTSTPTPTVKLTGTPSVTPTLTLTPTPTP